MKNRTILWMFLCLCFCLHLTAQRRDTLCFIQINDIYEISPLQGGKAGGIARIASYIDECKKRYATYTFVAGDFLSPSVMGTATVNKERLNGKQMVDGMNAIGVDYVTFGNHEFDMGEEPLQKRINESQFTWFSSNVFRSDMTPFVKYAGGTAQPFPTSLEISSPNKQFTVKLFSLTLPSNTPPYTKYLDYDQAMEGWKAEKPTRKKIIMGLTHLSAAEDLALLKKYPQVSLIMGGHEHENMFLAQGVAHVAKADANGKTIYKHLIYRNEKKQLTVTSELVKMDEHIPFNTSVAQLVYKWEEAVYNSFRQAGLEPTRKVCTITDVLNGTEASIRYSQNNMGNVVTDALTLQSSADMGMINSGSIRIDDHVSGEITELDVIRIMPFGNKVYEVTMKGSLLEKIISTNDQRKGSGGYLQMDNRVSISNGQVRLSGQPIEAGKAYKVRTTEFLISGKEQKLEYFSASNPEVIKAEPVKDANGEALDLRKAFIQQLKQIYN